ncbi:NAD(P)-binding protein [Desulforamulus putei]|uniref:NAD(P)-binding protein n=1 Tax=Desulforamulus putei TaxID=74701 RepID=UPI002FDED1A9
MSKVKITIDGKEILAEKDSILLEVARENGFNIPSFCHDPRLKPFGACRQCLVEIEGARGLVQACGAKVSEGMVVRTNTDKVIGVRRLGLELLLAEHNGDCVGPCQLACPAEVDIQGFVAHIANGQIQEAAKLIREKIPLPSSVGRVCPSFCEKECRRNLVDGPVSICALKRFAGDFGNVDGRPYVPPVKKDTGKQVAVIGGGPAGLAAAYYLALAGHRVSIFEAAPQLGGMMRYGIPEYRLPKTILDREIEVITGLCRNVFLNKALGRDFSLQGLKQMGFDAVFIGIGSWANQSLQLPGEDLKGVYSGIQFLREVASRQPIKVGNKVVVIGGGNVAMDAARTSIRLGAKEVTVVYRRTQEQMPANHHEIAQALEEGIKFQMLTAPVGFVGEQGSVTSLKCIKMQLGEPDASGRRRPVPVEGSEFEIPTDMVIIAIGQKLDKNSLLGSEEIVLNRRGNIDVNTSTMQTNIAWLFAAGDCVSGPATVVQALAAGRKAANSIDQFLKGQVVKAVEHPFNCTRGTLDEIDPAEYADRERIPRTAMPTIEPDVRKVNFDEFELGFTPEMAKKEAERCLSCGCLDVFDCKLREYATELKVQVNRLGFGERNYPVFSDHPEIIRDPNKCILCGNCVRFCHEVVGVGALGFVNRGSDTVVLPSLKKPLTETTCNSCGQCVAVCPTGALTFKVNLPKPGPWKTTKVESVCTFCNIGCKLEFLKAGDQIVNISSPVSGDTVNDGILCGKGMFAGKDVHRPERLRSPLVNKNGNLEPVSWQEAIGAASDILGQVRDFEGLDSIAVAVSPRLSNEENYLAYKIGRMYLGTNKIYSTVPVSTGRVAAEIYREGLKPSLNELASSDLIMVVGGEVPLRYPIIAYKIRKAVENGSKLLIIGSNVSNLDPLAAYTLRITKSSTERLFESFVRYILQYDLVDGKVANENLVYICGLENQFKEDFYSIAESFLLKSQKIMEFIHLYIRARNPVIVVDGENLSHKELDLLSKFAFITGNLGVSGKGIITLYPYGNMQYQFKLGIKNDASDYQVLLNEINDGSIKGLLVVGDSAELDSQLFKHGVKTVVISPYLPKDINADVILPGAMYTETNGSVTNVEGKVQRLQAALRPLAGKENWEILIELAQAFSKQVNYSNQEEIYKEVLNQFLKR